MKNINTEMSEDDFEKWTNIKLRLGLRENKTLNWDEVMSLAGKLLLDELVLGRIPAGDLITGVDKVK
jgi:hypothetical protein